MLQTTAACFTIGACASIGTRLQVKGSDALWVAAGVRLLLIAGRGGLAAAAGVWGSSPTPQTRQALEVMLTQQLFAVERCMSLVSTCERADAIAVFAATTAAPDAFLPWLTAASEALLVVCRAQSSGAQ